jgi:hypothetical protein
MSKSLKYGPWGALKNKKLDEVGKMETLTKKTVGWMEEASCKEIPKAAFFEDFEFGSNDTREKTVELCVGCPSCQECGSYGVATKSTGLWGGKWLMAGKPGRLPKRTKMRKH